MKKIISVIYAAALALSLCGCDKTTRNSTESGTQSETNVSGGAPENPGAESSGELISLNETDCSCTSEGFYYLEDVLAKNGSYKHIMYVDFATKQETYLCSDSSCDHNNERCTSCFAASIPQNMKTKLFVYGEYLYILYVERSSVGGLSISTRTENDVTTTVTGTPGKQNTSSKQCLYRINLDGTSRTLLYTFESGLFIDDLVFGDNSGDSLWFNVHEEHLALSKISGYTFTEAKKPTMIKLSLSPLDIVEQIPVKEISDVSVDLIYCLGNKFVFSGIQYPDGMTKMEYMERLQKLDEQPSEKAALEKSCRGIYYTLDRGNKVFKEFYSTDTYTYSPTKYKDDLYLLPYERGAGKKVNIETGAAEDYTAAEGFIESHGLNSTFADKFLCRSLDEPPESSAFYFVDPLTGEASRCELLTAEDFAPIQPIAVYDGKAFVLHKYDMEPDKNGKYRGWYPEYAFMTLDDLFNGRPFYEPVKMLEKGEKK